MHFGFLIEPGLALSVADRLRPLTENVRGQIEIMVLDWQKDLKLGQTVLFADIEAGSLTGTHEDTGAVTSTHDCVLGVGKVTEACEGGFVRIDMGEIGEDLIPAAAVIGVVPPETPAEHAEGVKMVKSLPDWIIVDHCLCYPAPDRAPELVEGAP